MKRKKILFLITKSNFGGAQRYVFDLATNLDPDRYEVAVAFGPGGELARRLRRERVRTLPIPTLANSAGLFGDLQAFGAILQLLWRERPDVLHVNSGKAGVMGALAGRVLFVPRIVFTAHGWAFNEDRPEWQKFLLKLLHALTVVCSHAAIAVSHAAKRELAFPLLTKNMRVIHNGRREPTFVPRERARETCIERSWELAPYARDPWSATVAELHPTKHHDVMLRAMKIVKTNTPRARHLIIGSGVEEARLRKLIKEYGLTEHVFLLGQLDDAARYLAAFDLFVLPSRSEAFPYALVEACFAGLPIVASEVGGIPELLADGRAGVLVPQGDVPALAHAYISLIENESRRAGYARAAEARASHFSLPRMVAETVHVYEE